MKKEFWSFVRIIQCQKTFLLLVFLLFFLPGESFYEQLRIKFPQSLVRNLDLGLPPVLAYHQRLSNKQAPFLTAKSAIVIDVSSRVVIFAKNPDFRLAPASTTKITTALVALDQYHLNDILTVPDADGVVGRIMGLERGERITVNNLLYGLLVQSANDAAFVLASEYPRGRKEFISLMDKKVAALGCTNTHFVDASGLDMENHYSTTRDLANLAVYAMKNPVFASMVKLPEIVVTDVDNQYQHDLKNTDKLIGKISGLRGVKTGWTENAGECLVSDIKRGSKEIVAVILGSEDRFGEMERLTKWVFDSYQWQKITLSNQN